MINFTQLKPMFELQNNMNKTVHPDWATLGWDYMRASCLEGSEAIEHHGWKWWKKQNMDLPQLQMEIIDIWHFYLSRYLQLSKGDEALALVLLNKDWENQQDKNVTFDGQEYSVNNLLLLEKLDLMIGLCAAKRMNLHLFFLIAKDCQLTWDDLFEQYIKKNLLNIFRQKNGYKEGTYHKTWFGQEDNIFLLSEAKKLDPKHEDYVSQLWSSLEKVYQEAKAAITK